MRRDGGFDGRGCGVTVSFCDAVRLVFSLGLVYDQEAIT